MFGRFVWFMQSTAEQIQNCVQCSRSIMAWQILIVFICWIFHKWTGFLMGFFSNYLNFITQNKNVYKKKTNHNSWYMEMWKGNELKCKMVSVKLVCDAIFIYLQPTKSCWTRSLYASLPYSYERIYVYLSRYKTEGIHLQICIVSLSRQLCIFRLDILMASCP